jgi:hypothetical protein
MVRLALLAVLVAACLAAAPAAQAADLPVSVPAIAGAVVAQAPAPVAEAATTVASTVRPASRQVAVPATAPAVDAAAALPEPTARPAEYTTAAAISMISDGPVAADDAAPSRSARFHGRARGHTDSGAVRRPGHHAPERAAGPVSAPAPAEVARHVPRAAASTFDERPIAPDRMPSGPRGGVTSAPAAALWLGGLALLAFALCLAGPRLCRRLLIPPIAPRSVAFVSLLERPG